MTLPINSSRKDLARSKSKVSRTVVFSDFYDQMRPLLAIYYVQSMTKEDPITFPSDLSGQKLIKKLLVDSSKIQMHSLLFNKTTSSSMKYFKATMQ